MNENETVIVEWVRSFNLVEFPAQTEVIIGLVSVAALAILLLLRGEWSYSQNSFRIDKLKERLRHAEGVNVKSTQLALAEANLSHKQKRGKLNTRWVLAFLVPILLWVGLFVGFHSVLKPLALQAHIRDTYLITVSFEDAQDLSNYKPASVRHPERGDIIVRLQPYSDLPTSGWVLVDPDGVMVEQKSGSSPVGSGGDNGA